MREDYTKKDSAKPVRKKLRKRRRQTSEFGRKSDPAIITDEKYVRPSVDKAEQMEPISSSRNHPERIIRGEALDAFASTNRTHLALPMQWSNPSEEPRVARDRRHKIERRNLAMRNLTNTDHNQHLELAERYSNLTGAKAGDQQVGEPKKGLRKRKFKTRNQDSHVVSNTNSRSLDRVAAMSYAYDLNTIKQDQPRDNTTESADLHLVRAGPIQGASSRISSSVTYAKDAEAFQQAAPTIAPYAQEPNHRPMSGPNNYQHEQVEGIDHLLHNHKPMVAKDLLHVGPYEHNGPGRPYHSEHDRQEVRGMTDNVFGLGSPRQGEREEAPLTIGYNHLGDGPTTVGPLYDSSRGPKFNGGNHFGPTTVGPLTASVGALRPSGGLPGIWSPSGQQLPITDHEQPGNMVVTNRPSYPMFMGHPTSYPLGGGAYGPPGHGNIGLNSRYGDMLDGVSQGAEPHPLQRLAEAAKNQQEAALAYERRRLAFELEMRRRDEEARKQHHELLEQRQKEQQQQQQQQLNDQQSNGAAEAKREHREGQTDEANSDGGSNQGGNYSGRENEGDDRSNEENSEQGVPEKDNSQQQQQQTSNANDPDMKSFQNFVGSAGDDSDFTDLFPPGIFTPAEIREMKREQQEEKRRQEQEEQEQDSGEAEQQQNDEQQQQQSQEEQANQDTGGKQMGNDTEISKSSQQSNANPDQKSLQTNNNYQLNDKSPDVTKPNNTSNQSLWNLRNASIDEQSNLPSYLFANVKNSSSQGRRIGEQTAIAQQQPLARSESVSNKIRRSNPSQNAPSSTEHLKSFTSMLDAIYRDQYGGNNVNKESGFALASNNARAESNRNMQDKQNGFDVQNPRSFVDFDDADEEDGKESIVSNESRY